jgi:hypothetical protein
MTLDFQLHSAIFDRIFNIYYTFQFWISVDHWLALLVHVSGLLFPWFLLFIFFCSSCLYCFH